MILFISHDASVSGAPIVLLSLLRWIKNNTDLSFMILLRESGPLESEFAAIAQTLVFEHKFDVEKLQPKQNLFGRVMNKFGFEQFEKHSEKELLHQYQRMLKEKLFNSNIDLIYSNTVTNGNVLEFLSDLSCPVICHVHELDSAIKCSAWFSSFKQSQPRISKYIAASKAVKNCLLEQHNVLEDCLYVVHEFIDPHHLLLKNSNLTRQEIFSKLDIPENAKLVCASGSINWRKGVDLFIQTANYVLQDYAETPVHFLWVGGQDEGKWMDEIWVDVCKLGYENYIHFIGLVLNPFDYFMASDVFILVSREDPFPLVCLEAALAQKPLLCFNQSGGAQELIEDDCGFVVPYLDTTAMANRILQLIRSSFLRKQFGQRAAQKVKDFYTIDIAAPKVLDIIFSCL